MSNGSGASGSQLVSLIPGANVSGSNVSTPTPAAPGGSTPSVGGQTNPFLSAMPTGQTAFPANSPFATGFPAPNFGSIGGNVDWNRLFNYFRSVGLPGQALTEFLGAGGAGYNPQVAAAFVNSMMPEFAREQANLTEQFGAGGLRSSSAAAVGMGDLLSRQGLDVGQVLASMYEQAVQNYISVLMGAIQVGGKNKGGGIMGALSGLLGGLGGGSGIGSLISGIGGLFGGSGGSSGTASLPLNQDPAAATSLSSIAPGSPLTSITAPSIGSDAGTLGY